jgi:hypothetical protein
VDPDAPLHLVDAGQHREDLAVGRLLNLCWGGVHSAWFKSFGIHPTSHWALLRPTFQNVHPQLPLIEVDIIFGNVAAACWPPSTDQLVAVEAKCWKVVWEDLEPWNRGQDPQTNLWDQMKRNREAGFDRVAGIDIVVTEPGPDYWEALGAADALGDVKGQWLRRVAEHERLRNSAGYALFSFGAVCWKDESRSGTLGMPCCLDAPVLPRHQTGIEDAVRSILTTCSRPVSLPCHFVQRDGRWEPLGDAS